MKVIIFNDTQNFNGSLNFINKRFNKKKRRFWDYTKYLHFLIEKIKSLDDFNNIDIELVKVFFYEGKYSNNLIRRIKWGCHQKIREINQMINKEQVLLNLISQSKASNYLRKKINQHVENIKKDLEKKKQKYFDYIKKQERNFKGQKRFFKELEENPLIEIKSTPLKQREGEVNQKGIDVLLATDLVHLAHTKAYDIAIILSGDTDLIEAVKLIKNLEKIPIIISYHTQGDSKLSNISDLMNVGKFINLKDFTDKEIEKMSELKEGKEENEEKLLQQPRE